VVFAGGGGGSVAIPRDSWSKSSNQSTAPCFDLRSADEEFSRQNVATTLDCLGDDVVFHRGVLKTKGAAEFRVPPFVQATPRRPGFYGTQFSRTAKKAPYDMRFGFGKPLRPFEGQAFSPSPKVLLCWGLFQESTKSRQYYVPRT